MSQLWFFALFQPLLNALILIYTHVAGQNLGVAVIIMTACLRVILLPFSILSERSALKEQLIEQAALEAREIYKNDPVAQEEEVRRLMKKHRISPWARVFTLAAQAAMILVLYQVFIHGVSNERIIHDLYPGVSYPGKLNTVFLGFEIGKSHQLGWAVAAAGYLLVSTVAWGLLRKKSWEKSDVYFLIFFPLAVFVFLWYLPMVKSLFVLTTAIFSDSIKLLFMLIHGRKELKS